MKWIDVNDELPEEGHSVLMLTRAGGLPGVGACPNIPYFIFGYRVHNKYVSNALYLPATNTWASDYAEIPNVTHWMEITLP